jgi:hypothetical protein
VLAGWAVRGGGHRSPRVVRATSSFAAVASIGVGLWWVAAAR